MNYNECRENILSEIENSVNMVDSSQIDLFLDDIVNAGRVFCDGKGRSGLQAKAFVMRLAQMGITSYETSEVTTPAIKKNDLLIICSGSGETPSLVEHTKRAKVLGTKIVLITTNPDSAIGKMCTYKFIVRAQSKNEKVKTSIQPMATLFEQTLEIFFDIMVVLIMKKLHISNEDMYARHNNLE